jgi:hypothetical protein
MKFLSITLLLLSIHLAFVTTSAHAEEVLWIDQKLALQNQYENRTSGRR